MNQRAKGAGPPVSTSVTSHTIHPSEVLKSSQVGLGSGSARELHDNAELYGAAGGGSGGAEPRPGEQVANGFFAAAGDVREQAAAGEHARRSVELRRDAATVEPVAARHGRRATGHRGRARRLREGPLADAERERETERRLLDELRRTLRELPGLRRGVVNRWQVALVTVGASAIDAAVVHGTLKASGADASTVWLTSVTLPLALLATMLALGALAGAIADLLGERTRLVAGVVLLLCALGATVGGIVSLTLLRDAAVASQNESLNAIARDEAGASFEALLPLTFLGFLQCGALLAGIVCEALYVLGRPGRLLFAEIAAAERRVGDAETRVGREWTRAEQEEESADAADGDAAQARVTGAAAEAELEVLPEQERAARAAVRAEARPAAGRYATEWQIADAMHRNGGVRLAAAKTERIDRTWVTPAPQTIPHEPRPAEAAASADKRAAAGGHAAVNGQPTTTWRVRRRPSQEEQHHA